MPQIKVLDKHVAELIAAGEVVERPASVIKELVENSIDAGATQVTVEIQNGGVSYMRVTDNGCGISRNDVPTAFLRHATSKVSTSTDLDSISTLGFRGEALASVAAVARVEMMTCKEGETGVIYKIYGGEEISLDDAGCPVGTTIIVRDLFYNTPARMKFLKKDVGEANAVAGVLDKIALSHPEISVRFIRDGKNTLNTPGDGDLKAAIYAVFGRDFASGLIKTDYTLDNMSISGYIGAPVAARSNRNMQHFYINGRYVKSKNMIAAVEQAYKNSIMVGKFPSCVLNLSIPFNMVDINVSPSKTEARFVDERAVFNIIYYGVKTALNSGDTRPELKLDNIPVKKDNGLHNVAVKPEPLMPKPIVTAPPKLAPSPDFTPTAPDFAPNSKIVTPTSNYVEALSQKNAPSEEPVFRSTPVVQYNSKPVRYNLDVVYEESEQKTPTQTTFIEPVVAEIADKKTAAIADEPTEIKPEIKIIGELFTTYIIAECGEKVVFIDKHAAHERILFEKIRTEEHDSQMLLEPVTVTLAKEEYTLVIENLALIARVGFEIDDFGASSVIVRAVPTVLAGEDVKSLILEISGGFCNNKTTVEIEKLDWLYHNIACRAAIKAGSHSNMTEMAALAERIINHDDIRYCPHGRPVAFTLTKKELEKQFGRLQ
ncbi:MAG: DNA mismatch repair endonuclease MutL [Clostridia bacterium]|nr:DNA mismatch repair endonuclease MutL [Clostridia bacterium]